MAAQLQFLFQPAVAGKTPPAATGAADAHHLGRQHAGAEKLVAAFSDPNTNIIHYAWVTLLPPALQDAGNPGPWFLLCVVYDLDFTTYVDNLLKQSPGKFDDAFKHIKGGEKFTDMSNAAQRAAAIKWIASQDLTQTNFMGGGVVPKSYFQAYPLTVVQITG